jgi:hypothetical protein
MRRQSAIDRATSALSRDSILLAASFERVSRAGWSDLSRNIEKAEADVDARPKELTPNQPFGRTIDCRSE